MTLDELIDRLRRFRAANPELASQPALVVVDHAFDDESREEREEVKDVGLETGGVVVSHRILRGTQPSQLACGDEFLEEYERRRFGAEQFKAFSAGVPDPATRKAP